MAHDYQLRDIGTIDSVGKTYYYATRDDGTKFTGLTSRMTRMNQDNIDRMQLDTTQIKAGMLVEYI